MMNRLAAIAFVLSVAAPLASHAQLRRPESWRIRMDTPAPDSAVYHVGMPPGWHITTGPASALYDPANSARGRYAVEAEVFLFPGQSQEGYGLFLGGTALDGPDASWIAFLVRRDGGAMIERRGAAGTASLLSLPRSEAVKPHPGGNEDVRNVLRVLVEPDSVRFEANGARIAALPRGDLPLDGTFGFRVGRDVNLHVSQLDHTVRLAPPRARR